MLQVNRKNIEENKAEWEKAGIKTYDFDVDKIIANTRKTPQWLHFGGGNIFRAFIAKVQQDLLNKSLAQTGIIVATMHNEETITKLYRPYDNLSIAVTMNTDGTLEKEIIGSITESLICKQKQQDDWNRLKEIFRTPSLQIVSFTITEKAYKLKDQTDEYLPDVVADMSAGPKNVISNMGKITALLYERYQNNQQPITFLSMDNCSHNGDKIKEAVLTFAQKWQDANLVDMGFAEYVDNDKKVSFPWSMIDKITPQPAENIRQELLQSGIIDAKSIKTDKGEYSLFVNAEKVQYLVVEDKFPNGRPSLEKAGVIFTDRDTVDKVEKMKVCTCLNPLHTALAVYGCLLDYTLIADELRDKQLKHFIELLGYKEGLPVVTDPKVLNPKKFIEEVINNRFSNPNVPDTPQRIASDTSQKVGIRFGETIKAYGDKAGQLQYIPLAIAGWLRYLMGIDDNGEKFNISPDPLLKYLQNELKGITLGDINSVGDKLTGILSNVNIFGVNLYEVGLGKKIEADFKELIKNKHAVRNTLINIIG